MPSEAPLILRNFVRGVDQALRGEVDIPGRLINEQLLFQKSDIYPSGKGRVHGHTEMSIRATHVKYRIAVVVASNDEGRIST
jgi:hypothetical protein